MGAFQADPAENAAFQAALQVENTQLQVAGLQAQQFAAQVGLQAPPMLLFGIAEGLGDGTMQGGERTEANFR